MKPQTKQLLQITIPRSSKAETNEEKILIKLISTQIIENWNNNKTVSFNNDSFLELNHASLHRDTLVKELGNNYRRSVDSLLAKNDIKIAKNKEGKEIYSSSTENKKGKAFTKCYSLSDELFYEVKNKLEKIEEVFVPIRRNKKINLKNREKTTKKQEKIMKIQEHYNDKQKITKRNLDELFVSEEVYESVYYDYFDVRNNNLIKQLNEKNSSVRGDERLYHPLILMKKELRQFVKHSSGEELILIDAASLNPTMMAKFIKNSEQKKKWMKYIYSGNFYTELMRADISKKTFYKSRFCVAMSDKAVKGKGVAEIRSIIDNEFSSLQDFITKVHQSGKTVNAIMQKLETKIFRNEAILNSNKFHVSMHDGLLVKKSDLNFFLTTINAVAKSVLGHLLLLTTESLSTSESSSSSASESVPSVTTPETSKSVLNEEEIKKLKDYTILTEKYFKGKKLANLQQLKDIVAGWRSSYIREKQKYNYISKLNQKINSYIVVLQKEKKNEPIILL